MLPEPFPEVLKSRASAVVSTKSENEYALCAEKHPSKVH